MKLYFKQRLFSWLDSYDIYDETGNTLYTVRGQLSWGHRLKIFDAMEREVGTLQEVVFSFLPRFELWVGGQMVGSIRKAFTFFRPRYEIDCNGWQVEGSFTEWDYTVRDAAGAVCATVTKELLNWTDTYSIEVTRPEDALTALMLVLAIDAEKCSRQ